MKDSILIKGGTVLDAHRQTDKSSDVRISGGQVIAVANNLQAQPSETVLEAKGLWVCPGFIDIHTHLRDLGQKDKEDIESGTRAAAAGGYTCVVAMANTDPPVDNAATLSLLLSRIEKHAHIDVLPVASVTRKLEGLELTNMVELADLGAVAFSDDGMTIGNLAVLRRALEYCRLTGRVIISHAEDRDLSSGGCMQESSLATALGLPGIPAESESAAVAREIEIVRLTQAPYHFTHLSCARSVKLVRRAKEDGLPVTADVTPHHIALHVNEMIAFDTNYKMKPPLRMPDDCTALIEGLSDGTIDAIATDHAPHTRLDKHTTMQEAAVGIIGLETAFAICYEKLVLSGALKPLKLVSLFTTQPAAALGLSFPSLEVGAAANLTIFDPGLKWEYDAACGASKSGNSPFSGRIMHGKPILTLFNGKPVHRDDGALSPRLSGSS